MTESKARSEGLQHLDHLTVSHEGCSVQSCGLAASDDGVDICPCTGTGSG